MNEIKISNPNKLLWPEQSITKLKYLEILNELSPYILKYSKNKMLTSIHYPDGVNGKSFFQKNKPSHAPKEIKSVIHHDIDYIVMDNLPTLLWMGNMAALEFHTPFNKLEKEDIPDFLVFDLDPSTGQIFKEVKEAALIINNELKALGITSFCKTSGASGLQILIPTGEVLDYTKARELNLFFAQYFCKKYPKVFTIERIVKKRGRLLYFDYLQMWRGKTIIMPYSPRATKYATVSAPLKWDELEKDIEPKNYNLINIKERLNNLGDLISCDKSNIKVLDSIYNTINKA